MSSLVRSSADAMIPSGDALAALQLEVAQAIYVDSPIYNNSFRRVPWDMISPKDRQQYLTYAASALNFMRERIQGEMNRLGVDLVMEKR